MAVGKDKVGVLVNMDKELKAKLESIAKDDGRSLTNLINKSVFTVLVIVFKRTTCFIVFNHIISFHFLPIEVLFYVQN